MTILLFTSARAPEPLEPSTPITVAAGALITANADGPAALLPDLTARLVDTGGNVIIAPAAVTITQDSDLGDDIWRYTARLAAPLTIGTYAIQWQGPETDQTASEPVIVKVGIRPSIDSVAALLRARTKVTGGRELGTFTSATRPTDIAVEGLIDDAVDEVLGKVQPIDLTLPVGSAYNAPGSDYERRISSAIRLYAAILIELSYFPEQVKTNQSPVAQFQQLYDSRIRALIAEGETGRAEGMGSGPGGGGDAPADPAWSFPQDNGALVGWGTRW